jgi:MFS family permease
MSAGEETEAPSGPVEERWLTRGRLGDRRGFALVLSVGAAAFATAFLGLAAGGALIVLGAWFVAAGVGIGCVETAQHAVVATNAPARSAARRSACSPVSRA